MSPGPRSLRAAALARLLRFSAHTRARRTGHRTSRNNGKNAFGVFEPRVISTDRPAPRPLAAGTGAVGETAGGSGSGHPEDGLVPARGPRAVGGRGVERRGDWTGERLRRRVVPGQRGCLPRQDHQGQSERTGVSSIIIGPRLVPPPMDSSHHFPRLLSETSLDSPLPPDNPHV